MQLNWVCLQHPLVNETHSIQDLKKYTGCLKQTIINTWSVSHSPRALICWMVFKSSQNNCPDQNIFHVWMYCSHYNISTDPLCIQNFILDICHRILTRNRNLTRHFRYLNPVVTSHNIHFRYPKWKIIPDIQNVIFTIQKYIVTSKNVIMDIHNIFTDVHNGILQIVDIHNDICTSHNDFWIFKIT